MGRCFRVRKRKKLRLRPLSFGFSPGCSQYFAWLKTRGWHPSCKLGVADFPSIGRGIQALQALERGAVLARIPSNLIIDLHHVLKSPLGYNLNKDVVWDPQQIISLYFCWERHLGCDSEWSIYISMLPVEYLSPFFESVNNLSSYIKPIMDRTILMKEKVHDQFQQFIYHCKSCICEHCGLTYEEIFSFDSFMWSWFTVNSRCVYASASDDIHLHLSRPNNVAIVPFVDLFNHSNSANVSVQMVNNSFELVTNIPFAKYDQVFINYGSHCNMNLLLEYGFILKNNHHDVFEITLDEVLFAFETYIHVKSACSKHKYNIIKAHDLDKNLHCSADGLSWNTEKVITVLIAHEADKHFYEIPFQEQSVPGLKGALSEIGKVIVSQKISWLETLIAQMNDAGKHASLYVEFLRESLIVLDKCKNKLQKLTKD